MTIASGFGTRDSLQFLGNPNLTNSFLTIVHYFKSTKRRRGILARSGYKSRDTADIFRKYRERFCSYFFCLFVCYIL